uniref:Uncharacterized protein n=1 Tax=Lepeophtheirus salmonis TaxID=72036 RepID=A0A0K2UAQ4_LEPSM
MLSSDKSACHRLIGLVTGSSLDLCLDGIIRRIKNRRSCEAKCSLTHSKEVWL